MNKELRELLEKFNNKMAMAKSFMEDGENKDIDKAAKLMDEADEIKKEFDLKKRLYEQEKEKNTPTEEELEEKKAKEKEVQNKNKEKDSVKAFADAARRGFKNMVEGTPADGGYTVPEDIQTRINKYREAKASLLDLVTVEKVTTNKGQRTFKKRAQQTGFVKVGEGGKIPAKATPQFERLSYEIDKYAGYFPVTNELLADSDANIVNVLVEWIGDESRVTANKLILEAVKSNSEVDLKNLDGIKKALNVTLGQAFKPTSVIVTNDDGLQYLDTLKDNDNKYVLQPDPAMPMAMRLCAGATSIPVKVVPNADLPTDTGKVPFIIGDLKEGVVFWDRQLMNIKTSDVAAIGTLNAFEEDLTVFRAIEREDVTVKDAAAFVNGYITVGA